MHILGLLALALLTAALAKGHLALVVFTVINTAIAIYYYLGVVREAWFRDPGDRPAISLTATTRILCLSLIAGILFLGIVPSLEIKTGKKPVEYSFTPERSGYYLLRATSVDSRGNIIASDCSCCATYCVIAGSTAALRRPSPWKYSPPSKRGALGFAA